MSLADAIELSGGLREEAYEIILSRPIKTREYHDSLAQVSRFSITNDAVPELARRTLIERGDLIDVRSAPGFHQLGTVSVTGLFAFPGTYAIEQNSERLADIIRRAGGTLPTAFTPSFRLLRDGRPVSVGLTEILKGDESANLRVKPGDVLRIGTNPDVVLVTGAVERQVTVPYERALRIEDYIHLAGGRATNAIHDAVVDLPSGHVERYSHRRFFGSSEPAVEPGTVITVLQKPPGDSGGWKETLATVVQVTSILSSLAIAFSLARK
jgi:protein involved in polysaccharide export with SLBB domain